MYHDAYSILNITKLHFKVALCCTFRIQSDTQLRRRKCSCSWKRFQPQLKITDYSAVCSCSWKRFQLQLKITDYSVVFGTPRHAEPRRLSNLNVAAGGGGALGRPPPSATVGHVAPSQRSQMATWKSTTGFDGVVTSNRNQDNRVAVVDFYIPSRFLVPRRAYRTSWRLRRFSLRLRYRVSSTAVSRRCPVVRYIQS